MDVTPNTNGGLTIIMIPIITVIMFSISAITIGSLIKILAKNTAEMGAVALIITTSERAKC